MVLYSSWHGREPPWKKCCIICTRVTKGNSFKICVSLMFSWYWDVIHIWVCCITHVYHLHCKIWNSSSYSILHRMISYPLGLMVLGICVFLCYYLLYYVLGFWYFIIYCINRIEVDVSISWYLILWIIVILLGIVTCFIISHVFWNKFCG